MYTKMEIIHVLVLIATALTSLPFTTAIPVEAESTNATYVPRLGKAGDEIFRIGFDIVPGSYQVDENTWFSNRTWHLVDSPNTDIDRGNNDAAFAPRVDDCRDESTYENEWSNSSPLVADCWQIYNNIEGDGTWTVAINFHRELVNYGTCAFGVRSIRTNHITTVFYYVGNDDIRLTIDSAIEQMAKTDAAGSNRVGGEGRFECQPGTQLINWGIYHTHAMEGNRLI